MGMDLTGINNKNEYYTNHYFSSIFEENASDTINSWRKEAKENEHATPWAEFRDNAKAYYKTRDRYQHCRTENQSKIYISEMARLYLHALGYEKLNSIKAEIVEGIEIPIFHEETRSNGAPLLWAVLSVASKRGDDILQGKIFEHSDAKENDEDLMEVNQINDEILSKLFFAGEESPRWIVLIGINQIALIDRNKWNEKRYLQFDLDEIFSRHEETTFQALTVLLHKNSLCPEDEQCILDRLDENSHKHSAGVSDSLKYALRECIELLGNEVIYDMKTRQGIDLDEQPIDAGELTIECLRYMYRVLFMLFIEARPELGYAPMKSQTYVQGYSLEGLRDICENVREESEQVLEGYYIDDTISELFKLIYEGYPKNDNTYQIALQQDSLHDVFMIEPLKAHIFDPEYTKLITKARLRNCTMLQIIDLMSISRPSGKKERRGRISYSALGINQMGAVYEALLSYRGFIAEETLFEVKRAGDKFNELDVGYFVPERELENYTEDERVRYEKGEKEGQLRKYEKGTFIYRLAGREREKSASYYTPEVLTKCLVKYALKELLKDKTADEILNLTVCEPAMGSAAFLNEAINQLAEAYLNKKQEELGDTIPYDKRFEELQRVKMYIADRNVYGVDLNPIAVELAEVSLWLNTIYKGAYVPWFGTQLVCGNSLIGARRQVYATSKLQKGKWYNEAPERIMPGDKRKKQGTSRVYHFLVGDPGMANYTDKVIKQLEAENIKKINDWRKKFNEKYEEDDIKTLLRLSDTIDILWEKTSGLRQYVKHATAEPLSVYGHQEVDIGTHRTIREKDEILHRIYKSEGGENASPYARLKCAMDYWCALWFWPIDKADLLPTRQEFLFDLALILEGGIASVSTQSIGQMKLIDNMGDFVNNKNGDAQFFIEGSEIALKIKAQYEDLGVVNLDDLRQRNERLALANQIAMKQKFQHWELEFADLFFEKGGFDLVVGNPPWVKLTWNEANILGELYPEIFVKNMSSGMVAQERKIYLYNTTIREIYTNECTQILSMLSFYSTVSNYRELQGGQTDLFKCFLPTSWRILNTNGICGFVHPEGVYDEKNAGALRKEIYKRLKYHFQFQNEKYIFPIAHSKTFSINIYANANKNIYFLNINNMYDVFTVDKCFNNTNEIDYSKKDSQGNWNVAGNRNRILTITLAELSLFADIYGFNDSLFTRLPVIHTNSLLEILKCFNKRNETISEKDFFGSEMWHETYSIRDEIIVSNTRDVERSVECILSGPNIGEANMYAKQPNKNCTSKGDYDNINLEDIVLGKNKLPRGKYVPNNIETYIKNVPKTSNGLFIDNYRLVFRKMLSKSSELNLKCTIIPPQVGYVNSIIGYSFSDNKLMVYLAGLLSSIVYIYFVNSTGKMNFTSNTICMVPIQNNKYKYAIMLRGLRLNCISDLYSDLWKKQYTVAFSNDSWSLNHIAIKDQYDIGTTWNKDTPIYRDFERYITFVELDVLSAMSIGMSLQQLIDLYMINYPNMAENDRNTWYDSNGRIVFTTNKSFVHFGITRDEWESNRNEKKFMSVDQLGYNHIYEAPFFRVNRVELYQQIWNSFEERFKD